MLRKSPIVYLPLRNLWHVPNHELNPNYQELTGKKKIENLYMLTFIKTNIVLLN